MKGKTLNCRGFEAVYTSSFIEKKENKELWNKNQSDTKGITLVALVVTIVVLLILAGITITYMSGDNGIIKWAQDAKNQTEAGMQKEQDEIANLVNMLKEEYGNREITNPPTEDKVLATSITLDKPNGTATGGLSYTEDLKLTATLEPANVTEKEVTWTSSNPELATVDSSGNVKAGAKGGNVVITATTKDGTNLSAKSDVIVEIFGAVDNNTRNYTDSTYTGAKNTIKVPGGYAVGTSENVSKIENGFVIQDAKGNQFVWVPVDNQSEMFEKSGTQNVGILYDFSGTSSTRKAAYTANSGYREPDVVIKYDGKDATKDASYFTAAISSTMTGAEFKTQLQSEFNSMKTSVETNKGFYIGRYETGDLSKTTAVSKRNNSDVDNQNWYVQYQKCKTIANGTKATSSMIWGCQWDATLRWFQKSTNSEVKNFPTNSAGKGNYSGTQGSTNKAIPTGSNTNYMVNNIYDMGGNVFDWTLEANYHTSRVNRRRLLRSFNFWASSFYAQERRSVP